MIKLLAHLSDGRPLYLFGLSAMNIATLQQGMPILFDLAALGGRGQVAIISGDTEDSMLAELRHLLEAQQRKETP